MLGCRKHCLHTYRYKVSLRIYHPAEAPSAFTEALGLEPDFQHMVGLPRVNRRSQPLPGKYEESYWSYAFDIPADTDLEDFLLSVTARLAAYAPFFSRISSSGGRAELFIGFFVEGFNCGFSLAPELHRQCAALGLGMDFDIYGLCNNAEPAA